MGSISRYSGECLSTLENLHMLLGENFQKLCTKVAYKNSGIVHHKVQIIFFDHFPGIVSDTVNCIKDPFKKEMLSSRNV